MSKLKWFAVVILFALMIQPGFADDGAKIQGIWKLVGYEIEIQSTGQKEPAMGPNPTGYTVFTLEGRVWFVLTGGDRKPAKTAEEKAELLNTVVAYTGKYRVEGNKWITKVDVAWNPEWVGTEQVRTFKLEGNRLQVLTPWRVMPNWPQKGMTRSIVTFEREK